MALVKKKRTLSPGTKPKAVPAPTDKRINQKAQEFAIEWRWAYDTVWAVDVVKATTVPRAISKLLKVMEDEYSFKKADVIVRSVTPTE